MKRFHIHIAVDDLAKSKGFYSALFGSQPTVEKHDYAKWMLDDPHVNFAISARGAKPGVDHLGIQVDQPQELQALREQLQKADLATFSEGETTCCYANSDKSWVQDPSGIAWEAYHTMQQVEYFNDGTKIDSACCAPKETKVEKASSCGAGSGCC